MVRIIICKMCGLEKPHKAHDMCRKCYDISRREFCSVCGKLRHANARIDGKPLCNACYATTKQSERCYKCGEIKSVHIREKNNPVCEKCYRKYFRVKRKCSICGKKSLIVKKTNDQLMCGTCYSNMNNRDVCHICGEVDPINKRTGKGGICKKCYMRNYDRPKKACGNCGKKNIIEKVLNSVCLCSRCNRKRPEMRAKYFNNRNNYRSLKESLGELSSDEWLAIMRSTDWKCFYCGKSISSKKHRTIDHVVAVTKNGSNNILNLVPCCRSCNSSKGDRDVFDWIKYKNLELSEYKLRIIGGIK